jgi:hypothetical protein
MKTVRFLIVALILIGFASPALAQKPGMQGKSGGKTGGDMTAWTLKAKEMQINDCFKKQDSKTFLTLVDPNAWSVDATGIAPVSQVLGMFKDITIKDYSIEGYTATPIDKDVYVATYTWKGEGTYKGQAWPPMTYCSSVWAKRGGDWKCVFHQESIPMPSEEAQPAEGTAKEMK